MALSAVAPARHPVRGPGLRRSSHRVAPAAPLYKATVTTRAGVSYRVWLGRVSSEEHALQALSARFPGGVIQLYTA